MGNTSGSIKKECNAILLQPAIEGNLDKVKEIVGSFLASYSTSSVGYVDPASDQKLCEFVNQADSQGNNAIHGAVFAGHLDVVKYLVECCGASLAIPNNLGCFPLWLAAGYDRPDVLKYLLEKVPNPKEAMIQTNSTGDSPLLAASSRGNLSSCKILLDHAEANGMIAEITGIANRNGDLPLNVAIASARRSDELLDLLLHHTDDKLLNLPNTKGLTPLLVACERDDANLLQKLLDRHVDARQCDPSGASPLAIAAFCGSKEVLVLLLQRTSLLYLLEKPNLNGCTPLWLAARSGRPDVVELLLKAGADPSIANNEGISSIGAAIKYKRETVLELFNAQRLTSY
jgi:ankyrin repeat protein